MCRAKQKSRLWLHFIKVEDGNATNFIWEERGEESQVNANENVLCFNSKVSKKKSHSSGRRIDSSVVSKHVIDTRPY